VASKGVLNGGTPLLLFIQFLLRSAKVSVQEGLQLFVKIVVNVFCVLVHSEPLSLRLNINGFGHLANRGILFDFLDGKLDDWLRLFPLEVGVLGLVGVIVVTLVLLLSCVIVIVGFLFAS
jgi:hypothetical protein